MSHQASQYLIATLPPLPGIDVKALQALFHLREHGRMLGLYDHLVRGALSNGSLLALGIMPYISARIFVKLARAASPALNRWAWRGAGTHRLVVVTRVLTGGIALIQSYGFTRYVQSTPGLVAEPGPAFVARTVAAMTLGAMCFMWMGEQADATESEDGIEPAQPAGIDGPTPTVEALAAPSRTLDSLATWRSRSEEALLVTPLPGRTDHSND